MTPDLATVMAAWPDLSTSIRDAILTLAKTAPKRGRNKDRTRSRLETLAAGYYMHGQNRLIDRQIRLELFDKRFAVAQIPIHE